MTFYTVNGMLPQGRILVSRHDDAALVTAIQNGKKNMSLWKRLFGRSGSAKAGTAEQVSPEPARSIGSDASYAIPTVRFDSSRVTESIKSDVKKNIGRIKEFSEHHRDSIFEPALRSITQGRDLAALFRAIMAMNIDGMTKQRAEEIARLLHNKATALMGKQRQESLGITHAIWIYSGAPCHVNPKKPSPRDIRQDAAHKAANGKRYDVSKGMLLNGRRTQPGQQEGCRCVSRSAIPGVD